MVTKKKAKVVKNTIYVQIASYRDTELRNTLKNLLENAKHPENLTISVAWQHSPYDEWDTLNEFKDNPSIKIIDIDYRDARGPCWARAQLNAAYSGQKYTLQIDSHHRFVKDWDDIVITMLESLRSPECPKPLLSSYLPSFDPANDPESRMQSPWIMEFDRFAPEGPVHFLPHTIDDFKERDKPVPARFISGHFIFADGKFCKEVAYDPAYYFHGEEINLSVRAYMAGYDLYAPHRVFMWHEYIRPGKKKHWDDHLNWNELDKKSHKHNRELLGIDTRSSITLSTQQRSLSDYEKYAGLEFSTRRVHKDTLAKKLPPTSNDDKVHADGLVKYQRVCVDIYKQVFAETDYNFWVVAFEDATGTEIYRQDADKQEVASILSIPFDQDNFAHIWRNFYSDTLPTKWIVWPHSESKGWMDRLTGEIRY